MAEWKKIRPEDWSGNIFSSLNEDWMLITAADKAGKANTMTASWGCFGILWNKPVGVCFIRPQRYTLPFVEEAERFTMTFLRDGFREALTFCGTKSGRDRDKIAEAGLHPVTFDGAVTFEEAKTVLIGRKLYVDCLKPEGFLDPSIPKAHYSRRDFHKIFVAEIEKVLIRA